MMKYSKNQNRPLKAFKSGTGSMVWANVFVSQKYHKRPLNRFKFGMGYPYHTLWYGQANNPYQTIRKNGLFNMIYRYGMGIPNPRAIVENLWYGMGTPLYI